jgi:hypothetical protein
LLRREQITVPVQVTPKSMSAPLFGSGTTPVEVTEIEISLLALGKLLADVDPGALMSNADFRGWKFVSRLSNVARWNWDAP